MADGNLHEQRIEAVKELKLLRDHGFFLVRTNFECISEETFVSMSHYWRTHDHVGEVVNELDNIRRGIRDWIINNPNGGLVPAPDPVLMNVENPLAAHSVFINRGNTLMDLVAGDLNRIIGVVPNLGQAELQLILQLVSDVNILLLGLIEEGRNVIQAMIDSHSEPPESSSTSGSSSFG